MWMTLWIALVGCSVEAERTVHGTLSAQGLDEVAIATASGSLEYQGGFEDAVSWTARSLGSGIGEDKALEREGDNELVPTIEDSTLFLTAEGGAGRSVDIEASGPTVMDLILLSEDGAVTATDFEGALIAEGRGIVVSGALDSSDITSSGGGAEVAATPVGDAEITLVIKGNTKLWLPDDGDYDLTVVVDRDYGPPEVENLGFEDGFYLDKGGFTGVLGEGTATIKVTVTGGEFSLRRL